MAVRQRATKKWTDRVMDKREFVALRPLLPAAISCHAMQPTTRRQGLSLLSHRRDLLP